MSDEKNGNVKVRWFYIVFGTVTIVTGFLFWFQSKMDAKADLRIVKEVIIKQDKQDDILMDIRQRLIRIETKLEK